MDRLRPPRFETADNYRITFGLDVHDADAAEVHFGLRPDGRRCVLQVARTGVVFGMKDSDKAALRPLGNSIPFPPEKWFKDRRPYPEVQIERTAGTWAVRFNGVEAWRVADDAAPKVAEIRLNAENGAARVDSVIMETLNGRNDRPFGRFRRLPRGLRGTTANPDSRHRCQFRDPQRHARLGLRNARFRPRIPSRLSGVQLAEVHVHPKVHHHDFDAPRR